MGAAAYWAARTVRHQPGTVVVLALFVAVLVAGPGAAVAGARRTGSVADRFIAEQLAADVEIQAGELSAADIGELRALPHVEALGIRATLFVRPAGTDLLPFAEFFGVGSVDGHAAYDVFRPRVTSGSLPGPDDPDAVLVSETLAEQLDLEPGDRFAVDTLSLDAVFGIFETGDIPEPDGPTIPVEVAGIGYLTFELAFPEAGFDNGTILFTPAFIERYRDDVAIFEDLIDVRLEGGAADVPAFVAAARELHGGEGDFIITPAEEEFSGVRDGIEVARSALLILAVLAAAAGVVALAEVITRQAAQRRPDLMQLAALGVPPRHRVGAAVLATVPGAVAGAVLGGVGAVLLSPLLPLGAARRLEPESGFDADWTVLVLGGAAGIAVALAVTAAVAVIGQRRDRSGGRETLDPTLARWAARSLGPAAAVGVRLALVPGRGRRATPARSAITGAAIGVGGVIAAVAFAVSLDRLVDTPRRHGVSYDVEVGVVGDSATDGAAIAAARGLAAHDDVEGISIARISKFELAGETVDAFGLERLGGGPDHSIVEGRAPLTVGEVVMGGDLLDAVGHEIGDELTIPSTTGSAHATIVGQAVFPAVDDPDSIADGLGFTLPGLTAALDDQNRPEEDRGYPTALVGLRPGVDAEGFRHEMTERYGFARQPTRPASVSNLATMRPLVVAMVVFLSALGVAALAHAVTVAPRRRRGDLAVLRSLGFNAHQVAAVVRWQAVTIVVAGMAVGLPLGIAAGRWLWIAVASGVGVATDPLVPPLLVASLLAAHLVAAGAIAWWPARIAARTPPAQVLRTE